MKKILIVVPSFRLGGTTTALINFISLFSNDINNIYVYAITNDGVTKQQISEKAIIIGESTPKSVSNKRSIKVKIFIMAKSVFKAIRKVGLDFTQVTLKMMARKLDAMNFDIAIAFQEGTATWLVSKMNTAKKVAWVRCEYSRYLKLAGLLPEKEIYTNFDKIVSVSKFAVDNFVHCIPSIKNKTIQIYDFLDANRIIRMSYNKMDDYNKKVFTIVSIGRLDPVKRFSCIPQIASSLIDKGLNIKWLIIGGASRQNKDEESLIIRNIRKYKMDEIVIMMGAKSNPYSYLANSDMLVCLSSSETFNYTLTEAKILGIPIVTTNYACAFESVEDKVQGRIVCLEEIGETISEIITNQSEYLYMKNNLKDYRYNNKESLDKINNEILN